MTNKIVSYSLLAIQLTSLIGVPIANSYPILTYSGQQMGMHLSPPLPREYENLDSSKPIYLHTYKGITPRDNFDDHLSEIISTINPELELKIVSSNANYQNGQHRVLVGPVAVDKIIEYSQALKNVGVDSFPVYFEDETITLISPSSENNEEADVFKHSDTLSSIASTVSNSDDPAQALMDKTITYIKQETKEYVRTQASDWLSQYGTVNIDFQFDEKFEIRSGEFDLLVPFFTKIDDTENVASTWFLQGGAIFNELTVFEGRDFAHIGLGYRYKNESGIYGVNTFYDYDMERKHQRASVGLEYANAGVRFNSNAYTPISDWIVSEKKFADMPGAKLEERPARSLDFRFTGYIPSVPWLSISTDYQKFFGENIELSSNSNKAVKDPYLLNASLNFQPIPLLNFRGGVTRESASPDDYQVGVDLTYRLGVPFLKQVDPKQVAVTKALEVQMLDLVDRNHNIQLEYREIAPELSIAFSAKNVKVLEGEQVHLLANSADSWIKFSGDMNLIKSIDYEGSAASHIQKNIFKAPAINQIEEAINTYKLSVKVTLKTGQIVQTQQPLTIAIEQNNSTGGLIEQEVSSTDNPNTSVGNVGTTNGVQVAIKAVNAADRPIAEVPVTFTTTTEGASFAPVTTQPEKRDIRIVKVNVLTGKDGYARAVLSSQKAGVVDYTLTSGDVVLKGKAEFTSDSSNPSQQNSTIRPNKNTIIANKTDKVTVDVELKDLFANPLEGYTPVYKALDQSEKVIETDQFIFDNQIDVKGVYKVDVKTSYPHTFKVQATLSKGDSKLVLASELVTPSIESNPPHIVNSTISSSKPTMLADGNDIVTVSLSLQDEFGNILPDRHVTFEVKQSNDAPAPEGSYVQSDTIYSGGKYSTDVKVKQDLAFKVHAKVKDDTNFTKVSEEIIASAQSLPIGEGSTIKANGVSLSADGVATETFTTVLVSPDNRPMSGRTIKYQAQIDDVILPETLAIFSSATEGQTKGTYTVKLALKRPGEVIVKAIVEQGGNFEPSTKIMANVDSVPVSATNSSFKFDKSEVLADGNDFISATLTLMDANGNKLAGRKVNSVVLGFDDQPTQSANPAGLTDNGDGTYLIKITGSIPDTGLKIRSTIGNKPDEVVVTSSETFNAVAEGMSVNTMTVELSADSVVADDKTTIEATTTLMGGDPPNSVGVPGKNVTYKVMNGSTDVTSSFTIIPTESADGVYKATLKGTRVGQFNLVASIVNGDTTLSAEASFNATLDPTAELNPANSSVNLNSNSIMVDGTDTLGVTLKLVDGHGNPITGSNPRIQVVDSSDAVVNSGLTVGAITEGNNGNYSATITATKVFSTDLTVQATLGIATVQSQMKFTTTTEGVAIASVTLASDKTSMNAGETVTVTTNIKGGDSISLVGLPGKAIKYIVRSGSKVVNDKFTITEDTSIVDGEYKARLTTNVAGDYTVTAFVIEGAQTHSGSENLAVVALPLDETKSHVNPLEINIPTLSQVTGYAYVVLRDKYGNLLTGKNVVLVQPSTAITGVNFGQAAEQSQPGVYKIPVIVDSSTSQGSYQISVNVDNSATSLVLDLTLI